MKYALANTFLFLISFSCTAQDGTLSNRNCLFFDVAVKGALYSINYERVFSPGSKLKKSYRVGAGIFNNTIALPLGISVFKGKPPHYLDASLLFTPVIEQYRSLFNGKNSSDKKAYIMPGVGYRYQPLSTKFFARITAGPVLLLDPPSDNFWHMKANWYAGLNIAAGIRW